MHEANNLYKAEKYEEAIEHYETVVGLDPNYSEAWLNMGYAYRALFHPGSTHEKDAMYAEEGIKAFRKYLDLHPDSESARQYFIEFCTASLRHDDAIEFYEQELTRTPDNAELIKSLANLHSKKGDVETAMKWFTKWTEVDSQNPEAWYTIGVVSWERSYHNQFLGAEERRAIIDLGMNALGKALEIKPDYFEALSYMNLIYREKAKLEATVGNNDVAARDYDTADSYMKKALEIRNAQLKVQAQGG
jgi:tetratricopeptide (TPR) repeat protein